MPAPSFEFSTSAVGHGRSDALPATLRTAPSCSGGTPVPLWSPAEAATVCRRYRRFLDAL